MTRFTQHLFRFFIMLLAFCSISVYAGSIRNLLQNANDPINGNPRGKITIVEFFDYQCSHCASMEPVIKSIIATNPDVRVVYKEFPIRGDMSTLASRAALAANKQGKYDALHQALFATDVALSQQTILSLAKAAGLDIEKLQKDMNSNSIATQLNNNIKLAQEKRITGTPAFFVAKSNAQNEQQINFFLGEMSQSELQDAIDKVKK